MSVQAKVVNDWKEALKERSPKKDALSMIVTELKNRAIKDNIKATEGRSVSDDVAIEVLQKMAKQRKESIEAYKAANRQDLAAKEEAELSVVESYLPPPLTDDELTTIVKDIIIETKASSAKDMGKVMAATIKASAGRADGKRIQSIVQALLAGL